MNQANPQTLVLEMGAALVENRIDALERLWSEDYLFTTPIGTVLTKAQRLEFIRSGRRPITALVYDDLLVREYGDTAVVTGQYTETAQGGAAGEQGRITVVLVRSGDTWQMVAGHNSRITTL